MTEKNTGPHTTETLLHFSTTADPRYKLDLLALPEYQDRDLPLSTRLAERFSTLLEYANEVLNAHISQCQLQVTDGYTTEAEPHYQLNVTYGNNGSALPETTKLSTGYSATADGETYNGSVKISVRSPKPFSPYICRYLEKCVFDQYNDLMAEFYPEWTTTYNQAGIQFTPGSNRQNLPTI